MTLGLPLLGKKLGIADLFQVQGKDQKCQNVQPSFSCINNHS